MGLIREMLYGVCTLIASYFVFKLGALLLLVIAPDAIASGDLGLYAFIPFIMAGITFVVMWVLRWLYTENIRISKLEAEEEKKEEDFEELE